MVANVNKDIVIRFVGQNLMGPGVKGAINDADKLKRAFGVGAGRAIGGPIGSGIGMLARGGPFAVGIIGAQLAMTGLSKAMEAIGPVAMRAFENVRLNLAGVPEHARRATVSINEMAAAYEKLRGANAKSLADARQGFAKAVQPTLGPFPPSIPNLNDNEIVAAHKNRAALEKARMDAVKRFQSLAFGLDPEGRKGRAAFIEKGINELKIAGENTLFMRPELSKRFDAEVAKADKDVKDIERKMTKLDTDIERLQGLRERQLSRSMAFGRGVRGIAGMITGGIEGGALGLRGMLKGPVKWWENAQEQMQLEQELESPASRIRRELNDLERKQREGVIGPDLFNRARKRLLDQLRDQIPDSGPTPPLSATESRFLTRGADQQMNRLGERQARAAEKAQTELAEIKTLLANEARKPKIEVEVRDAR